MGTSQSSKGPGGGSPLVPPWADDQPQQPLPSPQKGGLRHFENRWEMRYQMEIEQISEKP